MTELRPAVFLDRDGVINRLVERDGGLFSPRSAAEFQLFPWTIQSLSELVHHGFELVVVTNQPDIARKTMSQTELDKMHHMLTTTTPIQHIYVCPHDSTDDCNCRKPHPGLLFKAATELSLDLSASWMIGDRISDIEAGKKAGTHLIHVAGGQDASAGAIGAVSVPNLRFAVSRIIGTV